MPCRYAFLADSYATEIEKVLSVWSMAEDADLLVRPRAGDPRGRNLLEHMVHQCVSEAGWFGGMFGIQSPEAPLPPSESRLAFLSHYAQAAAFRLRELRQRDDAWWETEAPFFETLRQRAWIMVRRIAHTAHHRGQQTALLRQLGRSLHSTYGPTADTGGLPKDRAPVVYAYPDLESLLREEAAGGGKQPLPAPTGRPVTERAVECNGT